jgi:DNA-binding SARP family transcriptional activator/tetratricopeptide (TPR) repeat protein
MSIAERRTRRQVRVDDTAGPNVLVGVLGSTSCEVAASPVPLRRRERQVLAGLALLFPGEASFDLLLDLLWQDQPPPTAKMALRNHLARIRVSAGRDLIQTTDRGYVLTEAVHTDLAAFDRATRQAAGLSAAHRQPYLEAALRQWRGVPFADLDDHPMASPQRNALEAARRQTEEQLAESLLAADRSASALELLERLVVEEPFRERRWALLVRARYRMGDRRGALLVIPEARRSLAEAGLDIGPELVTLQKRVLDDDPNLTVTGDGSAGWRAGVAAEPVFVGREAELQLLRERVGDASRRGPSATVVVLGEAGIGKTALAATFVTDARARGATVLETAGDPRPPVALDAWVRVVDQVGRRAGARASRGIDEALQRAGGLPGPGVAGEGSQARLISSLIQVLRRETERVPTVLVFDDVQLAPPTTVNILRAVVATDMPLTLVATVRGLDEAAARRLLGGDVHLTCLTLRRFGHDEVTRYLRDSVLVNPSQALAVWIADQSGGNPLLVREAVRAVAESDVARVEDIDRQWFGRRASRLLLHRLRRLSDGAQTLLRAASVFGPRVPVTELDEVCRAGAGALTEAMEAGILVSAGEGTVRFAHQLIQESIEAELSDGQRAELHEAAAEAAAAGTGDEVGRLDRIAFHHLAVAAVDPERAVHSAERAAEAHLASFSFAEAAARLSEACGVAADADLPALVGCRLAVARGEALRQAGDRSCVEVLAAAADLAEKLGEGDLLGRCALGLCRLGPATAAGHGDRTAGRLVEQALLKVSDPGLAAELSAAASLMHSMDGDASMCRRLYEDGEQRARGLGDERTLSRVLPHAYLALGHHRHAQRRLELADELAGIGDRLGDSISAWEAECLRFSSQVQLGDPARAATVARLRQIADLVQEPNRMWETEYMEASHAHMSGRLDEAQERIDATLRFAGVVAESRVRAVWSGQTRALRLIQGSMGGLADELTRLAHDQPGLPVWASAAALALAEGGRLDEARAALKALPDDQLRDSDWFSWSASAAAIGRVAAATAHNHAGEQAYDLMSPYAGCFTWTGGTTLGPIDTVLGLLADMAGDRSRARAHWRAALALSRGADAPCYEDEARRLLAANPESRTAVP